MATEEILEIQGDLVSVIQKSVVRQVKLETLLPYLVKTMPVTLPVLPRTAVFVHYDPSQENIKKVYFLCEVPAGIKTITKENKNHHNKRRYRLAFPWTYFWISAVAEGNRDNFTIDNYKCLHSRERFTKLPGDFRVAFLPNIYAQSGEICFGSTGGPVGSLADQVDYIVNNFYVTEFNDHLDRSDMVWPFGGTNFKNWVQATNDKGANAYKDFPEWDNGARKKYSINDLIGAGNIRTTNMQGATVIPEIPAPMTFGRAEEWLRGLTRTDRGRLEVAFKNIQEDTPEEIEPPVEEVVEETDDGGIPV